jgi:hypothetical protein
VECCHLRTRCGETGLEASGLAVPAVEAGLIDPFPQVGDDRAEPAAGPGVDSQHRAPDAGVLVLAWTAVGPSAVAQFEFARLKVLLELRPLVVCGFAVLRRRPFGPAMIKEDPVGTDQAGSRDMIPAGRRAAAAQAESERICGSGSEEIAQIAEACADRFDLFVDQYSRWADAADAEFYAYLRAGQ